MTQALSALLAKLEAATGPSRELDEAITRAIGFKLAGYSANVPIWWNPDDKYVGVAPHYTSSLDAAMTLVPEGSWWWLHHQVAYPTDDGYQAEVWPLIPPYLKSRAPTAALALCIASVRARLAGQKE